MPAANSGLAQQLKINKKQHSIFRKKSYLSKKYPFHAAATAPSRGTLVATLAELTAERKPNKNKKSFAYAKPFLFYNYNKLEYLKS